jgi:hypothetical protein
VAAARNAEIACTPASSPSMNRQFTAPREFTPNGTGHTTHHQQASMIRRRIAWKTAPPAIPAHARSVRGTPSLMRQ